MTSTIDLNADLGEDESPEAEARDIAIMDIVSSCNIACGGHAGSPESMRSIDISLEELEACLTSQLQDIRNIADQVGVPLTHLKPHGALYNDAQDDPALSGLLVDMSARAGLALVSMPKSLIQKKAAERNIRFIGEAFIDRRYTAGGRLLPRSDEGAVIEDESDRIVQGLTLAKGGALAAQDGTILQVAAHTLCLHSDSDGALETARKMRMALEKAGIAISAVK